MITVVALAVVVPGLLAVTFLGLRRIQSTPLFSSLAHARGGDQRGIALQTIIIMVVLLAIAGAVAAVLLTSAGTETDRLEGETDRWSCITSPTGCDIADGVWNSVAGTCNPPGTAIHNSSDSHAPELCTSTTGATRLIGTQPLVGQTATATASSTIRATRRRRLARSRSSVHLFPPPRRMTKTNGVRCSGIGGRSSRRARGCGGERRP